MKKTALKWELYGIIFIVLLGSILHFAFEWANEWPPVALIAAVNESVWEHLKIGFWPAIIYFLIEYRYLHWRTSNFLFAKGIGILLIPVSIIALFYLYTALIADNLIADILIFILAIIIGQLVSYRILITRRLPPWTGGFGLALLIIMIIAFCTLSYFAPHMPLFQDPVLGGYGIQ